MKVFVHGPYNGVKRIEFCCDEMAKDILLGEIKTKPWTDHPLGFWLWEHRILHCPSCGAEVQGECRET